MVDWNSRQEVGGRKRIIVRPNRSLTWGQTKALLLLFACAFCVVAIYFWQLGAWMVMPFLGVELIVLAGAFYFNSLRGSRGESIEFDEDKVWIETRNGWVSFSRAWIQVRLIRNSVVGRPSRLILGAHGRFLQIGEFLHDRERVLLAALVEETVAQGA